MGLRQLHREVKKSLTLFATHYFELTELPQYVALRITSSESERAQRKSCFPLSSFGGSSKPKLRSTGSETRRHTRRGFGNSKTKAQFLEEHSNSSPQTDLFNSAKERKSSVANDSIIEKLKEIDINSTSPIEALQLLHELQSRLETDESI